MKAFLVISLVALSFAPCHATPKRATPSATFDAAAVREQMEQAQATLAQMQALLEQSEKDTKRAQARARLKAQVRERRRQLFKIESGSKEV